jgi:hypothetical protein
MLLPSRPSSRSPHAQRSASAPSLSADGEASSVGTHRVEQSSAVSGSAVSGQPGAAVSDSDDDAPLGCFFTGAVWGVVGGLFCYGVAALVIAKWAGAL